MRPRPQGGGLLGMAQNMGVRPAQRRTQEQSLGPTRMIGNGSVEANGLRPQDASTSGGFVSQPRPGPRRTQPTPRLQQPVSQPAPMSGTPQMIASDPGGQAQPRGLPSPVQATPTPEPQLRRQPQQNSLLGLFSAMGGAPPRRRQPPPQRNFMQRGASALGGGRGIAGAVGGPSGPANFISSLGSGGGLAGGLKGGGGSIGGKGK